MFLFLFNFFPPQKVAKSASIQFLYLRNYIMIPYAYDYMHKIQPFCFFVATKEVGGWGQSHHK